MLRLVNSAAAKAVGQQPLTPEAEQALRLNRGLQALQRARDIGLKDGRIEGYAIGHGDGEREGYTQGWRWGVVCGVLLGALLVALALRAGSALVS